MLLMVVIYICSNIVIFEFTGFKTLNLLIRNENSLYDLALWPFESFGLLLNYILILAWTHIFIEGASNSQFRFKDETFWEDDVSDLPTTWMTVDVMALADSLDSLTLCQKFSISKEHFTVRFKCKRLVCSSSQWI